MELQVLDPASQTKQKTKEHFVTTGSLRSKYKTTDKNERTKVWSIRACYTVTKIGNRDGRHYQWSYGNSTRLHRQKTKQKKTRKYFNKFSVVKVQHSVFSENDKEELLSGQSSMFHSHYNRQSRRSFLSMELWVLDSASQAKTTQSILTSQRKTACFRKRIRRNESLFNQNMLYSH